MKNVTWFSLPSPTMNLLISAACVYVVEFVSGCGATSPATKPAIALVEPNVVARVVPPTKATIGCGKTIPCPKVPYADAWFEPEREVDVQQFWLDLHDVS